MNPARAGSVSARITPYEMFLEPLEAVAFPAIRDEAAQRGTDTRRRDQFVLLGHVGAALEQFASDDADPDAIEEYAELVYHGYQFWEFGCRLYSFSEDVTRELTEEEYDVGSWTFAGPPACYLQFPYQRLWSRVTAEAPYEPVDGCFVVVDETAPAPGAGAHLRMQLVLGLRAERPGVSLVSYRTDLTPTEVRELARRPWRDEGHPFASAIPGGERKGYRTLATTSELEALVIRALHHLDVHHDSLRAADGSSAEGQTHLAHVVVEHG
jgi:hypothetical protein